MWRPLVLARIQAKLGDMLFCETPCAQRCYRRYEVNALLTSISIQPVNAPFHCELLALNAFEPHMATALEVLSTGCANVIQIPKCSVLSTKGQQIIMDMFEALAADPEDCFLPPPGKMV